MSNPEHSMNRRDILKGVGAALGASATTSLAGCTDMLEQDKDTGNSSPRDNNNTESNAETEEGYKIQASNLNYNLSDLTPGRLEKLDRTYVDKNHSSDPEIVITEDGEEISLDEVTLYLENQNREEIETQENYTVPEYMVEDGETIQVTAETNSGEELTTNVSVNKQLPEHFYREIYIDGSREPWLDWVENITGSRPDEAYSTPFRFDTEEFNFEEFYEDRKDAIEDEVSELLESEYDTAGLTEAVEAGGETDWSQYSKQEAVAKASEITNEHIIGASGTASLKAYTMEYMLREFSDIDEPIAAGGLNNPYPSGKSGGTNHGSQMIHVNGDNYHSETVNLHENDKAVHVDNIDDILMVSAEYSRLGDYISAVAELDPMKDDIDFNSGMKSVGTVINDIAFPNSGAETRTSHDYETILNVRDLMVKNKFEGALLGQMSGIMHGNNTGRYPSYIWGEETIRAVSSRTRDAGDQLYEDSDFQGEAVIDSIE